MLSLFSPKSAKSDKDPAPGDKYDTLAIIDLKTVKNRRGGAKNLDNAEHAIARTYGFTEHEHAEVAPSLDKWLKAGIEIRPDGGLKFKTELPPGYERMQGRPEVKVSSSKIEIWPTFVEVFIREFPMHVYHRRRMLKEKQAKELTLRPVSSSGKQLGAKLAESKGEFGRRAVGANGLSAKGEALQRLLQEDEEEDAGSEGSAGSSGLKKSRSAARGSSPGGRSNSPRGTVSPGGRNDSPRGTVSPGGRQNLRRH